MELVVWFMLSGYSGPCPWGFLLKIVSTILRTMVCGGFLPESTLVDGHPGTKGYEESEELKEKNSK